MRFIDTLKLKIAKFKERNAKQDNSESPIDDENITFESSEIKGSYRQALDFESSMKHMIEQSNKEHIYLQCFVVLWLCYPFLL